MPKSHKRWTSYELMLKRVKKRSYMIMWSYNVTHMYHMGSSFVRDRRNPVIIAADRELCAINRAQRAEVQALLLALTMVFHPRLGEDSLWHDLEEPIMRMIVCEAYIRFY